MVKVQEPSYRFAENSDADSIERLLSANGLPYEDIKEHITNFIIAEKRGEIVGVAGVELIGDAGLLRSVAVVQSERGKGIGSALIDRITSYAQLNGVKRLFLLTTTACRFFEQKGFKEVERGDVPDGIRDTREFKTICPLSAVCMMKRIG